MKNAPHAADSRDRALAWVGKKYPAGWCLMFQATEIFGVPGVGDYDHDGHATAVDYWKAAVAHGKVVKKPAISKIPAGVMILWTGGSHGYGHAAYSLGNSEMVSTDLPTSGKVGRVKITQATKSWGVKLAGYVEVDGNGFTLAAAPPDLVHYRVTTKAGLRGRSGPGTHYRTKYIRAHGFDLYLLPGTVAAGGYHWAHSTHGTYYATEYLEKV